MRSSAQNIQIPVDYTNPGQFFACCGLLEVAHRLWPGAEGRFHVSGPRTRFEIAAEGNEGLKKLLDGARLVEFQVESDDSEADEDKERVDPIVVTSPIRLVLDWWSDKSIKTWAGSMKERAILHAMLRAIDPDNPDPFNDSRPVDDPPQPGARTKKSQKREPFYFDCRRGCNAHPLDSGFSPDTQEMRSECCPAVEAMCFVGLQRTRPAPTEDPNRLRYFVWQKPLPLNVIAAVACGLAPIPGSLAFTFRNFFRTDHRNHKAYSQATCERSDSV